MGAPLVGTAPIFALSFFGFDWGKQLVKTDGQDAKVELVSKELNHLSAILHVYAGGLNFMK